MISYIKGTLAEKMEGAAVVEAGSIGYRIFMPASALELLGAVGMKWWFTLIFRCARTL